MSELPPTRDERFSSDVIYFDEICDNCKKHYNKKISLKFHRMNDKLANLLIERNKICELVSVKKSNWVNIYTCGCYFNEAVQIKWNKLRWNEISSFISNSLIEGNTYICFCKKS